MKSQLSVKNQWITVVLCLILFGCTRTTFNSSAKQGSWSHAKLIEPSEVLFGQTPFNSVSCINESLCYVFSKNGGVSQFNGNTWSKSSQLIPIPNSDSFGDTSSLTASSCTASFYCVAVSEGGKLVVYGDGKWGLPTQLFNPISGIRGSADLLTIDCLGSTFCVSGGEYTTVFVMRNGKWSSGSVIGDERHHIYTISCASDNFCEAGDDVGNIYSFNGHSWAKPVNVDPNAYPDGIINSISCPTPDFCVAVDGAGNEFTFDGRSWNGGTNIDFSGTISSVSCPSTNFCIAVDSSGNVIEFLNGIWEPPTHIDQSGGFVSLDCTSVNFCITVDNSGDYFTFSR